MISSALAFRSSRGLSEMDSRPLFGVALVPSAPMNEATETTSGSERTTSASAIWRVRHAFEGDIGGGLGHPDEEAGVLLREEALGDDHARARA